MPPTAARAHETELLLCGHHYRISRRALTAAHATSYELPWTPSDTAEWIHDDPDHSLAPVS
jgi:predicted transcriptional regulator of viral defense system